MAGQDYVMSKIGSLGPVVFVVAEGAIRTIDNFNRSSSSRWAQHDIIGQKPKKEFLGPGVDSVTFSVRFSAALGLKPRKELDRLTELDRSGKAMPLIIGRKSVGVALWVITSLSQDWNTLDNMGNIVDAQATITLEEYVK
ncbi:phage tail protein [Paenibacillus graminis]|uniref:phage tail protein n=1 Tax=Paenibacillus graminis TaxID=189425 RepID=UPI002DBDC143|nr:phage tail protein [Paenibacillus graminis]MEC0171174.1 phage tail protein [Paenibacillus graminis]